MASGWGSSTRSRAASRSAAKRHAVAESVAELAEAGVGYITLAHLFWRDIATNAPALPFLSDRLYHRLFPQPDEGLSDLGRAAVKAMIEHRILIDVTHMSASSIEDTVRLVGKDAPLLASHGAARFSRPGVPATSTTSTSDTSGRSATQAVSSA